MKGFQTIDNRQDKDRGDMERQQERGIKRDREG